VAGDTITLALSGDVYLDDFIKAVSELRALVTELSNDVARGAEIEWSIEELQAGSATTIFRGLAKEADQQRRVEAVVRAYANVGASMERGAEIPYSEGVARAARGITSVLNGRIDEILFETEDMEAVITSAAARTQRRRPAAVFAYGAVEGKVQTLSSRTGLRFILYDAFGRGVPCHLSKGNEDMMRDAWDKWVIVEGRIRRDPTGKPISIRDITDVAVREVGGPEDYREARGTVPVGPDGLSPEEAIRRLRDA
jgi:hypothetical protein